MYTIQTVIDDAHLSLLGRLDAYLTYLYEHHDIAFATVAFDVTVDGLGIPPPNYKETRLARSGSDILVNKITSTDDLKKHNLSLNDIFKILDG